MWHCGKDDKDSSVASFVIRMWVVNITETAVKRLKAFEMWIWRRMARVSWRDKKTKEEVLQLVYERRSLMEVIYAQKRKTGLVIFWEGRVWCWIPWSEEWKENEREEEREEECLKNLWVMDWRHEKESTG